MKRCCNCFQKYEEHYDVCPHCGYYKGQPPHELYHLFPETVLADRYIVGQVLGFGGFGITYKAWDKKLETVVAIKEYYPSGIVNRIPGQKEVILFAGNKAKEFRYGLERFLDEARNTAKFSSHKNIVHVFEYFEENNTAYFVMEFLNGISLSDYLKDNRMELDDCIETIGCVAAALKELHMQGIVHRDVSPDNIFLCLNGNVKLIDFGAARFSSHEESPMTIILKPGFAPPEQYEKISAQGPWTDIYALGATLYLMLTGIKPEESTDRKTHDTLVPPHELDENIAENLSNTVMKAMALEQHMRFSTVEDFEKALRGEKKVSTLAQEKKRRKRKRASGILAAILVLTMGVGVLANRLLAQKEAETLPEATIYLAYTTNGDITADAAKVDALHAIADEFMNSYPEVTIELIEQGEEGLKTPSIIESATADGKPGLDLTPVFDTEYADACISLDEFTSNDYLPTGFIAPVIYCNKTVSDFDLTTVSDISSLLNAPGKSSGIAVNEQVAEAFAAAFGAEGLSFVTLVSDSQGFVTGEYAFYISTTLEYMEIQSKLPARYSLISFDTDHVPVEYSGFYSVSNELTQDEQKVAIAFLGFLLSDNAQDYYYIQNWSGQLPLNRRVLDVVEDVYSDFVGFFDNTDSYTFQ